MAAAYFAEQCKNIIQLSQNERIMPLPEMIMQVDVMPSLRPFDTELVSNQLFYPFNLLSTREQECFKLIISGYSTKAISEKLSITTSTINIYISRIKRKLECYNKQQMIEKAKSLGIIEYFL